MTRISVNTLDDLIVSIQNPKRRIRQAAIRQIITLKLPEAIPYLRHILLYDDDFLKREAAQALGQIGEPAVPALLEGLKSDNKVVRRYAAVGLGLTRSHLAASDLAQVSFKERYDPYQWVASNSVEALGRIASPTSVPALIEIMSDSPRKLQAEAANSLGLIRDKSAVPALLGIVVNTKNWTFSRLRAAHALGKIKEQNSAMELMKILQNEQEDRDLRMYVALALGEIGNLTTVPQLIEIMRNDQDEVVRRWAIGSLAELKDSRAVEPLIQYLNSGIEKHPRSIGAALFYIGTPKALAIAEEIFLNEASKLGRDYHDNKTTILWLGHLNSPRVIATLGRLLRDERPLSLPMATKSDFAAEALRKISTPDALAVIEAWVQGRK